MMNTVVKIGLKVATVFVGAMALGYAEYRLKGGEPIHKVYQDVKAQRIQTETATKSKPQPIQGEGTVN